MIYIIYTVFIKQEHPDHEKVWAEVAAQEQAALHAAPIWADEYFEQQEELSEIQGNANEIADTMNQDPNFEYSKVQLVYVCNILAY